MLLRQAPMATRGVHSPKNQSRLSLGMATRSPLAVGIRVRAAGGARQLCRRHSHVVQAAGPTNGTSTNGTSKSVPIAERYPTRRGYPFFSPVNLRDGRSVKRIVLTVDGGGLRGMIPARVLEELEQVIKEVLLEADRSWITDKDNKPVPKDGKFNIHLADFFDVMSGTSTGSIITTYLATKGELGRVLVDDPKNLDKDVADLQQMGPETKKEFFSGDPAKDKELIKTLEKFTPEKLVPGTPRALQSVFAAKARRIFPKGELGTSFLNPGGLFMVKYSADGVEGVLKQAFSPDGLLSNSLYNSLVIPTFHLELSRTVTFYYRNDEDSQAGGGPYGYATLRREEDALKIDADGFSVNPELIYVPGEDFKLWEVVRSSSAAPTFLPPISLKPTNHSQPSDPYWTMVDGGMTANDPGQAALVFTTAAYKDVNKLGDLAMLSLGCGNTTSPVTVHQPWWKNFVGVDKNAGGLAWLGALMGIMFNGTQELASAYANHFVGYQYSEDSKGKTPRYLRVNKVVETSAPNDGKQFPDELKTLTLGKESANLVHLLEVMDDCDTVMLYHKLAEDELLKHKVKVNTNGPDGPKVTEVYVRDQLKTWVRSYLVPSLEDYKQYSKKAAQEGSSTPAASR